MFTNVCKNLEEKEAVNKTLVLKGEILHAFEVLREKYDAEEVLKVLEDKDFMLFLKFYLNEKNKKKEEKPIVEEVAAKPEEPDESEMGCVTIESIMKSIQTNTTDPKKLYEDIALLMRAAMNSTVAEF